MALTKIKTSGIADNAITNAKMADDAIDSADFANASIDLAHMSVNSVDSDQYVDGSIDNVHLAGSIAVSKTLLAGGTGLTLSTNTLNLDTITSVGTLTALTGGTGDFNWDSNTLVVDSSASKVGIGTASPFKELEIHTMSNGNLVFANSTYLLGSGTGAGIQMLNDAHNAVGTFIISGAPTIFPDGNVGIGGTPTANLEVFETLSGTAYSIAMFKNNDIAFKRAASVGYWYGSDSNYSLMQEQIVSSGLVKWNFKVINAGTTYDNNLVLDRGNVGIGDSSPASVLSVKSDTNNNVNNGILFEAADSINKLFQMYENSTGECYAGFYQADTLTALIRTNGSSYFNGGNVGIGTNAPDVLFHLKGGSANDSVGAPALKFQKVSGGAVDSGQRIGSVQFWVNDDGVNSGSTYERAAIVVDSQNTSSGAQMQFWTGNSNLAVAKRMTIMADGYVGINNTSPANQFSVHTGVSGYVAEFRNTTSGTPYKGITIQCGYTGANFVNTAVQINDGDGDEQGTITFTGGTVAYNTFTAGHFVELPSSDNDDGYDYGTLVETTEIFYTQVNNADSERGILYKVQKSSSEYSKGVLGVYSGKFDDKDNLHQVYVLGDGHILCNGEKGNILVGDGICTSSTNGEGMKADKMAMIIGIAQEDVSFSGSESKLVAVQYGLQQFTPWENA